MRVAYLQAAESWGIPPWVVAGQDHPTPGERLRWLLWRSLYQDQLAKNQEFTLKGLRDNGR